MLRDKSFWLLFITALIIFGRVLFNGFVGDDPGYINHPYIQQFKLVELFSGSSSDLGGSSPVTGSFYRPLMLFVFALIFLFFGKTAWIYHLFQLVLHVFNSYLIFLILKKFSTKNIAIFLSLMFLIHPINVETYAYISNIQDVLFVLFGLLAMNLIIKEKMTKNNYCLFGIFLLLSLFAKETALLFIVIFVIYIYFIKKDKNIFSYALITGLTTFYLFIRFSLAKVGFGQLPLSPIGHLSLSNRLMQIPYLVFYYLKTLIWPAKLSLGQTWVSKNNILFDLIFIFLVGILLISTVWITKKNKYFAFFTVWFLMGLIFHLQIIPLEMTVADRWFYFPFIGLLGMSAIAISKIIIYKLNKIYSIITAVLLIILASRSFVRLGDWKDAITLYRHDSFISSSYLLENSLGYELMQIGNNNDAFMHLNKSVNLFQTSLNTNSLGVFYYRNNDINQALKWFARSIQLGDYYLAYQNYGRLAVTYLPADKSIAFLQTAIKKFPNNDLMQLLMAIAQYKNHDYTQALEAAGKAYILNPNVQNRYVLTQLKNNLPINILGQ